MFLLSSVSNIGVIDLLGSYPAFVSMQQKPERCLGDKAMHVKVVSYEKSHYNDGTKCSPTLRSVKLQSASGSSVRWLELYNGDSKGDQLYRYIEVGESCTNLVMLTVD